jgi:hypothetical protein
VAKDPLAYKYTGQSNPDGTASEFVMGVPSRDIKRSEFDGMSDVDKAALHDSPIHRAYGSADEEAEKAAERVYEAEAAVPMMPAATPAPAPAPVVEDADAKAKAKR